jgi:hypothetical protein
MIVWRQKKRVGNKVCLVLMRADAIYAIEKDEGRKEGSTGFCGD